MSPIKNVALVNELGQVVNHIVVDTDNTELIEALHKEWASHRYVETTEDDVIVLDADPEIWTTHCDSPDCKNQGFVLPEHLQPVIRFVADDPDAPIIRKKSELPAGSLLLEENAADRPDGWVFPSNVTVVEG